MAEFDPYLAAWTGLLSIGTTILAYIFLKHLESRKIQRTEKKLAYSKFLQLTDEIITVLSDLYNVSLIDFKKPKNEDEASALVSRLMSFPTILSNDGTMEIVRYYIYGHDDNTTQTKQPRLSLLQAVNIFFEDMQTDLVIEMGHIASKQTNILNRHGNELIALNVPTTVRNAMSSTLGLIQERGTALTIALLAKLAKQPLVQDLEPWSKKWSITYQALKSIMELDLKKTL